jgi:hypothetical protein
MRARLRILAVAVAVVVAACGGGGGDPGDDDPDAGGDDDPAPQLDDTAAFVELSASVYEDSEAMSVRGELVTEAPPVVYDVDAPVGACRYSQLRATDTCTPFCEYPELCIDGACVGLPELQSAGDLELASGATTRTVEFVEGAYYLYEQNIPWEYGDTITLTASGDEVPAFTAAAALPQPLDTIDLDQLVLRADEDLTIRWQPADPGSRIRITLGADRGHAQLRAALIECDLPDDAGEVTIGGDMVTRFVDPENWSCGDCFSQEIKRYRRATATAGSTEVTFWVSQTESFYLVPDRGE